MAVMSRTSLWISPCRRERDRSFGLMMATPASSPPLARKRITALTEVWQPVNGIQLVQRTRHSVARRPRPGDHRHRNRTRQQLPIGPRASEMATSPAPRRCGRALDRRHRATPGSGDPRSAPCMPSPRMAASQGQTRSLHAHGQQPFGRPLPPARQSAPRRDGKRCWTTP